MTRRRSRQGDADGLELEGLPPRCGGRRRSNRLGDAASKARVGWIERDQARLQSVIDVRLSDEVAVLFLKVVAQLRTPASRPPVDQATRREVPDAAIPRLVNVLVVQTP